VYRKKKLDLDSPERQLINRTLTGLRYSYEEAGGATCRPLAHPDRAAASPAVPYSNNSEAAAGLRGIEGAGAAEGRPAPAGVGAADRGGPSRNEVGAEGAAGAARRTGGVGGVDLQPADPADFHKAVAAAKAAQPKGVKKRDDIKRC
jgi:hypothetical protein